MNREEENTLARAYRLGVATNEEMIAYFLCLRMKFQKCASTTDELRQYYAMLALDAFRDFAAGEWEDGIHNQGDCEHKDKNEEQRRRTFVYLLLLVDSGSQKN
jgi:hypothetical protein